MVEEVAAFRAATPAPLNVNFFCHVPPEPDPAAQARWHDALAPFFAEFGLDIDAVPQGPGRRPFDRETCDALEPLRPEVVSFHFGLPEAALLERVKAWGATVLASATTVAEAERLEARGADAVIVQGLEAGGHRGMFLDGEVTTQVGTLALLPQVREAIALPLIAAGGIADARGVAAARALGADGVQVGTALLCCPEATISAIHRRALQSGAARHTALTNLYSGRPARGIVTRLMRELGPMAEVVARRTSPGFTAAIARFARRRRGASGSGDFLAAVGRPERQSLSRGARRRGDRVTRRGAVSPVGRADIMDT